MCECSQALHSNHAKYTRFPHVKNYEDVKKLEEKGHAVSKYESK